MCLVVVELCMSAFVTRREGDHFQGATNVHKVHTLYALVERQ